LGGKTDRLSFKEDAGASVTDVRGQRGISATGAMATQCALIGDRVVRGADVMTSGDQADRRAVPWQRPRAVKAVGIAPEGQVPFVPNEAEMKAGIEAAQRVDIASENTENDKG